MHATHNATLSVSNPHGAYCADCPWTVHDTRPEVLHALVGVHREQALYAPTKAVR